MRVDWGERKSDTNRKKHGISFDLAQEVFDDPLCLSRLDRVEGGEERWHTVGMVGDVVLLLVVHTLRSAAGEEIIRIISARKATKRERDFYEEGKI